MNGTSEQAITLPELRRQIGSTLSACGISPTEAKVEAQIIVRHVSSLSAAQQILFSGSVPASWLARVNLIIDERRRRVPLQYILGETEFMGLHLAVKPGVFIPRADTEIVVETAEKILVAANLQNARVADIGCGVGAIAVSLAKRMPELHLWAVDISNTAIELAEQNARALNVHQQIEFVSGSWPQVLPNGLDLVVSNPPYIERRQAETLPPEVVDYEPAEALFGLDDDGLGHYRLFAQLLPAHLNEHGGYVCLEVGDFQAESVALIFQAGGWSQLAVAADGQGTPRAFSAAYGRHDVKKR